MVEKPLETVLKSMTNVTQYCGMDVLQLEIVGNDGYFYFPRI
jgi:hypothetical protein